MGSDCCNRSLTVFSFFFTDPLVSFAENPKKRIVTVITAVTNHEFFEKDDSGF